MKRTVRWLALSMVGRTILKVACLGRDVLLNLEMVATSDRNQRVVMHRHNCLCPGMEIMYTKVK